MKLILINITVVIIFILTSIMSCYAFDKWTKQEIVIQGVVVTIHLIDWLQTLEIAGDDRFYETNPLLKRHPSEDEVHLYMGLSLLAKTGLVWVLPRDYTLWGMKIKPRTITQSIFIGVSGNNAFRNHRIGVRIRF